MQNGHFLLWAQVSRNKRSVVLDPDTQEGQGLLTRLVGQAGVVAANLSKDVLEQWDCLPSRMLERNLQLVVVRVSCYSNTEPLARADGNGSLAEAFAGLTRLTGERGGPPC